MTVKFPLASAAAFALSVFLASPAGAEEYRLPDPVELQTFSRDAMPFYVAGIAALDRADYGNAYSSLAKASQLQPEAARLNQIVAALALKLGRSKPTTEARGFYDTALLSYENILRNPGVDDDTRRDVMNRLRVAKDERDNLEQRDARRESIGTYFIQELNRTYVEEAKKKEPTAGAVASPTPAPAVGQPLPPGSTPLPGPGVPLTGPVVPGVSTPAPPNIIPTPAPAGGPAGVPGPIAPTVPGFPAASGNPPLPGAPPVQPAAVPGPAAAPPI